MQPRLLLCGLLAYITVVSMLLALELYGVSLHKQVNYRQEPIPWEYDYPYRGKLNIQWEFPWDTHKACEPATKLPFGSVGYMQACAFIYRDTDKVCKVVLPIDTGYYAEEYYNYIIRHEIAHCNGWSHK